MPHEAKHRVLALASVAHHLHGVSVRHLAYLFWLREKVAQLAGRFEQPEVYTEGVRGLASEAETENIIASPMTMREFLQSYATFWPSWTPPEEWGRSVWMTREKGAAVEVQKRVRLADFVTSVVSRAFPLVSKDLDMDMIGIRDRLRRLSFGALRAMVDVVRMLRPDMVVDYCANEPDGGDSRFVSALTSAFLSRVFPKAGIMVDEFQGDMIDFCHSLLKHYDTKTRTAMITSVAAKASTRCPVMGELVEPVTIGEMLEGPLFQYEKCVAESTSGLFLVTMLGAAKVRVQGIGGEEQAPVECFAADLLDHMGPSSEVHLYGLTPPPPP